MTLPRQVRDAKCGLGNQIAACFAIVCVLITATGWPLVWVLQVAEWLRGVA